MKNLTKTIGTVAVTGLLIAALAGCGVKVNPAGTGEQSAAQTSAAESSAEQTTAVNETTAGNETTAAESAAQNTEAVTSAANVTSDGAIDASELFTDRDLRQTADLSDAVSYTVSDGEDIEITEEGVYVISGSAKNVTITVDTDDQSKVQIVLDGISITNDDFPCIYVKSADKVFVTTTDSDNYLAVTGTFAADGDTNTDGVIFSKDDLVLNGVGTLTIESSDNGVVCKDDLKITGGTISIDCEKHGLEAHDSIAIADGSITIMTPDDGLHAEDNDDDTVGYIYICGGTLDIQAGDDAIHATTIVQVDGGDITIQGAEGIEGTYVQINGGEIYISASDDGINAGRKSNSYTVCIEINGGYITVVMGAGDTDGIDSNGNLYVNGGTVDVKAQSPFDYDGVAEYNGGTIIVNGSETNQISNQFGGGGMGGMGGMGPGGRR